ncbi:Rieske (2Fe-2S) protein [Roseivirga misakiensis]|uniref:Rieske domain-containing protein n=1 Tax=Roseivirga misakiensis TaxID=1563681 RepID=A0A1E5T6U3_9BACT|nr:Rieske 2Fe-2S domain-containing protein [Roseivirga misakiensis]OEK07068.1 hypothetical protein BFP71_05265 [Roseivirga misakiensis]
MKQGRFKIFKSKADLEKVFESNAIRSVKIGDRKLCIANNNGRFHAFEALCPHQRHPLVTAEFNDFGELICPLHSYRFSLTTGQEVSQRCEALDIYPLDVTDEGVFVKLY